MMLALLSGFSTINATLSLVKHPFYENPIFSQHNFFHYQVMHTNFKINFVAKSVFLEPNWIHI